MAPDLSGRRAVEGSRRRATPYGVAAGAFSQVEFAPVRTMAMRIEATMSQEDTVSIAEWRVGRPAGIVPAADLKATQTFALNGDALDWTLTPAQRRQPSGRDRRSRGAVQLRGADGRARRHLHEEAPAPCLRRRPRIVCLLAAQQRRRSVPRHDADRRTRSSSTTTAPAAAPAASAHSRRTSTRKPRRRCGLRGRL